MYKNNFCDKGVIYFQPHEKYIHEFPGLSNICSYIYIYIFIYIRPVQKKKSFYCFVSYSKVISTYLKHVYKVSRPSVKGFYLIGGVQCRQFVKKTQNFQMELMSNLLLFKKHPTNSLWSIVLFLLMKECKKIVFLQIF